MLFTRYSNAEDFERDTKEILMRHEIQNNLFFRNIGKVSAGRIAPAWSWRRSGTARVRSF